MPAERTVDRALLALALLGSGCLSLLLGQDRNFDQLQYHIYAGWSLLAGRFDRDIAAAGLAAYFNPLMHVPSYLGVSFLPPRLFGFLLGAVHGLNAYLAYRLAWRVLRGAPHAQALAALAGLVAMAGPCAVNLLGTTFGDNTLAPLVLGSLLLLCAAAEAPPRGIGWRLVLAGVLGGLGAGLKLTYLVFAIALAVGAAVVATYRRSLSSFLAFGAGGIAGSLLAGGYWGLKLWHRFGNPVFPFANNVFRSPFLEPVALYDPNWAARGLRDYLLPVFDLALGRSTAGRGRLLEIDARDIRYLLIALLLAAVLARLVARRDARRWPAPSSAVVVATWLSAYLVWIRVFHYYRYFAAGEFIAPAVILALLRVWGDRRLAVVWSALAVAIVSTAATGTWGRMAWRDQPLRVEVPMPASPRPAIVLVCGPECSYTLPSFPQSARFFGIFGSTPRLQAETAREIEGHDGPLYLLAPQTVEVPDLARYGLAARGACVVFKTGGRGRYKLCPLERSSPEGPARPTG